jgi:hypothetical protein
MDKTTFAGVCSVLATLPSNVKWDDSIAQIYLAIMRGWDDRVVGAIMRTVLLKCEFRPTVAELRNIGLRMFGDVPTLQQVLDAVSTTCIMAPANKRIDYGTRWHPCVNEIVYKAGGWTRIGNISSDESKAAISEAYAYYIISDTNDHFLTSPPVEKKSELESGEATVKAITE